MLNWECKLCLRGLMKKNLKKISVIVVSVLVFAGVGATVYFVTRPESQETRSEASGSTAVPADIPAFPGAEGFGAYSKGGRGGRVIEVTNLKNKGAGSLSACIKESGPRICVFRVGGTIKLQNELKIENPYITIAGQTAPGDGITVTQQPLKIRTNHVVIRHMRFRMGDWPCTQDEEGDTINIKNAQFVILDHVSASWSIDETLSIEEKDDGTSRGITIQWSFITEGLNKSCLTKKENGKDVVQEHAYGSLLGRQMDSDAGISVHHSMYAHQKSRSPKFLSDEGKPGMMHDFRNNVIYNWSYKAAYTEDGEAPKINYVGNYIKPGPNNPSKTDVEAIACTKGDKIYASGNYIDGLGDTGWDMIRGSCEKVNNPMVTLNQPTSWTYRFDKVPSITETNAQTAYQEVLADGGATLPKRDVVDTRIVNDVKNGTGGIINSQNDVGGYPDMKGGTPPADTDHDGMPDEWENQYGFNPESDADGPQDEDGDGYTNVEEYLNGTKPSDPGCTPDCSGKECGDDGCGGSCGTCESDETCSSAGKCEAGPCTPDCSGKECGDDGCGGSCGSCDSGEICSSAGKCETSTPTDGDADLNDDGKVNMIDYALFVSDYLDYRSSKELNDRSDLDGDDKINLSDYALFVEGYLEAR